MGDASCCPVEFSESQVLGCEIIQDITALETEPISGSLTALNDVSFEAHTAVPIDARFGLQPVIPGFRRSRQGLTEQIGYADGCFVDLII